jgi:AraC-like DNA-binding protein
LEKEMKKQDVNHAEESAERKFALKALVASIARWTNNCEAFHTAVPGLTFYHHDEPTEPANGLHEPSICLVAQGTKRVLLDNDSFVYDVNHYLIASVHLPTTYQVLTASRDEPYLGLLLKFDLRELSQLMVDSNLPSPPTPQSSRAMATGEVTLPLLSAFQRLVGLLDAPKDIPILAPIIHREILYRLLVGDQGARLRQIASAGSRSHQIARAIDWLKGNFSQQLRIDDLAEQAHMSTSSFHNHFRSLTSLSPLQYQKHLRLQEARRLMLAEHLDATTAAFRVGYESSSQFSREYSRLFGVPPLRDITGLRQLTAGSETTG